MSRPQSPSTRWKLALPALVVAMSAALATQAGMAQAAPSDAKQTYALVHGDEQHISISGHSDDWPDLKQMRRSVNGEFLWFRDGGKSWIVQDPAVLAKANAAYAPLERLSKQMDGYGKEMNQHGKAMDVLGKDMARAAEANRPDPARMQALQGEMKDLSRQMGRLGQQMGRARDDAERRDLQAQMTRLGTRMGELGGQMGQASDGAGQREARDDMREIGQRMDDTGKPMHALGAQMKVLGKQMKQESEAADKTVRALIRDAMARGLARPAPQG